MELGSIHDAAANGDLDLVKKIVAQDPRSVNQNDKSVNFVLKDENSVRHLSIES